MSLDRGAGILMPISSLPDGYGIGTLGDAAYCFCDYLQSGGQKYWQILPTGPTGFGDSPYSSFSAFAGNPYFIDLDYLVRDGLLKREDLLTLEYSDKRVDYAALYNTRFRVLEKAYTNFNKLDRAFFKFCLREQDWLDGYALYMALKARHGGRDWQSFGEPLRRRDKDTLYKMKRSLAEKIGFHKFLQYKFFQQWFKLKKYANDKGIKIIGDIPIYVAPDSADLYFNPRLFDLDRQFMPRNVAGCPPDDFSPNGQRWGNPLYNWRRHRFSGYEWWVRRIEHAAVMYDVTRIDHFRGFDSFYAIPASASARSGRWKKGPGMKLFHTVRQALGDIDIIAEDLGFITDSVVRLLDSTGYFGMKVLQFGFSDCNPDNKYLPHNYPERCVAYTGTHDNATSLAYFNKEAPSVQKFILNYLSVEPENVVDGMIASVYASKARLAIIPMADILKLGSDGRINTPSTSKGNWQWRIQSNQLNSSCAAKLKRLAALYNRQEEQL